MHITPIKTPIVRIGDNLFEILEKSLPQIQERDVVVVTSKIVALCEKAVVKMSSNPTKEEKHKVVADVAEYYIDPHSSKYHMMLTIKDQVLAVNAGIDESNVEGYYVLWPKNLQESTNQIWKWIRKTYQLKEVGVIMSDSRTFPLKWGVIGTSLANCGFKTLNDMRGKPDLFGRPMKMTQINVADALAVSAVYEMGEADEATPLAIVKDVKDIQFQDRIPTDQELDSLRIVLEDDVYAPILEKAEWKKGGSK